VEHTVAADELKDRQRQHWNSVADGWAARLAWMERQFSPALQWFESAVGWGPGMRLLDVACGSGLPALTAASRVQPGGSVVATDISPEMLAAASRQARAAGLRNVEFAEMDAEALRFEDGTFDAVTNGWGLMFCPDPGRAVAEAHRVLKPHGRLAIVTWDEPAKSPFFTVISGAVGEVLALPPPDPNGPGPFRLSSPRTLESLLGASGFDGVRIESVPMTVVFESVDEYCQVFADVAWKARMAALSAADAARVRAAVARAAQPYTVSGRLHLVATALAAVGRRGEGPA
jgi:SAM-dependent methyltransferase